MRRGHGFEPSRARLGGARNRRGAVLVEFAMILPLFLLILIGTMEYARAFNIWQVVVNSARVGARIVALPPGAASNEDLVRQRIGEYLTANALDPAQATIEIDGINAPPGTIGEVRVEYPYTFTFFGGIATLLGGSSAGSATLASTSRMRNE